MTNHFVVTTTAATKDEASRLATLAVENRLAACGQVSGPITSVYWWGGDLQTGDEWVCTFKTSARGVKPLQQALRAAHGYDTPEIVATPVVDGDVDYLAWVDAETTAPD